MNGSLKKGRFFCVLGERYLCTVLYGAVMRLGTKLFVPHRLKQSPPGGAIPEPVSFTDCSFILQCFPCTACSPRKALRGCCPDTGSLRRLVDCELIRPRPRASGVDLVCCVVCES
ncbi:hypothetical protein RB195_012233 [Necator americanus]|uniref:Secreted protein n=1 Tax=Necator americanus TaxID=51031 RepID=A0ABR1D713_NECAM